MTMQKEADSVGMDDFVRVMKALSDPGRVRILKLLSAGELCACQIIRGLGLAQPTVSRHMRLLTDAGLVRARKAGAWVHYRLAGEHASPVVRVMLERLSGWLEDDAGVLELRAAVSRGCGELDKPGRLGQEEASAPSGVCGREAGRNA